MKHLKDNKIYFRKKKKQNKTKQMKKNKQTNKKLVKWQISSRQNT